MFRLYNLAKRKKGVSPVIAVVLLIALTVAAAAVIWAIVNGLIGGVTSVQIQTTDSSYTNSAGNTTITWQGTVQSSDAGTVSFELTNSTGFTSTGVIVSGPNSLDAGSETAFSVGFTANDPSPGSYTLRVTVTVDGKATIETTTFSVSA